ncbi:MAG: type II secretion system protein [Fimbriimonas sp.]
MSDRARRLVFTKQAPQMPSPANAWAAKLSNPSTRRLNRAITLIELLTVMAISAILMGLIIIPLVQSFNMTRTAQAFADAQDRARILTESIALEIGNAVAARSTSGLARTQVNGILEKVPQHSLLIEVPGQNGTIVDIALPYTKIDLVRPAEGDPGLARDGAYVDPNTGYADPTLSSPKGQVSLPLTPGTNIVRYFIGRRNPFENYNNPYDGILMVRNSDRDNLYTLYRAEVNPFERELVDGVERLKYFLEEVDGNGQPILTKPILDDPRFFTPNRDNTGAIIRDDDRARVIGNWLGIDPATNSPKGTRRAVVQTEVSRYDMVQTVFNTSTRKATYDANIPRVVPLIQFSPSQISNDPAEGQVASRQGEETNNAAAVAPDVYVTRYGLWDRALIRNWPKAWNPNDPNLNEYNVLRGDITSGDGDAFPLGVSIYAYDPESSPVDFDSGVECFDVTLYENVVSTGGRYPFSQAVNAANARSGWFDSPKARSVFVPFTYRAGQGRIITSFGINEVGDITIAPSEDNPQNLPYKATCGRFGPTTPLTDTDTVGQFWQPKHDPINEKFNKIWVDHPNLQPQIHRFIDLRVTRNADGSVSPLHPTQGFDRAVIVPGSEEVYGPDQLPGPNQGKPIRYTRTTQTPGPNQYNINYVDQNESNVDYSLLLTPAELAGFNRNVYDERNFASAIIQPRYKKGYLRLNSDPTVPLPDGAIMVSYRFQFNGAGNTAGGSREDVFAVEYDTRQLINVQLTIRNYPQSTIPNPQGVTLKSTAAVRNYIR